MIEKKLRRGLRIKFEKGVDPEVRRAILEFAVWLRQQVDFPIRVPVYVKKATQIKSKEGELVCGTFWEPDNKNVEPYIRVSTGDYYELIEKWGKDNALASILDTIAHEIAHYEQWLKDKPSSCRSASNRARILIKKYSAQGHTHKNCSKH